MDTVSILLLRAVAKYLALLRFGFDVFVVHFISARSCSVSVAFFYLCCDFTHGVSKTTSPCKGQLLVLHRTVLAWKKEKVLSAQTAPSKFRVLCPAW